MSKKEEIHQATIKVVNEYGLEGATISKISKQAKVSPGIIYHYFDTKDEIIKSLFDEVKKSFFNIFSDGEPLKQPILDCYKHIWKQIYRYGLENPEKLLFMEKYRNSAYQKDSEKMAVSSFLRQLSMKNKQAIEEGKMKELPIEAIYTMTVGVSIEFVKLTLNGNDVFKSCSLESVADAVCRSILTEQDDDCNAKVE